jgi:hypothetical protein
MLRQCRNKVRQLIKGLKMARGGKRLGAGRPRGSVVKKKRNAYYNTRMTNELKSVLQMRAQLRGVSLAREIELRLTESVKRDGSDQEYSRDWGNAQNFALARYLAAVAQFVESTAGALWGENRFVFEALRSAIAESLEKLSHHIPSGPSDAPQRLQSASDDSGSFWLKPKEAGRFMAFQVWQELKRDQQPDISIHPVFNTLAEVRRLLNVPSEWDPSGRY